MLEVIATALGGVWAGVRATATWFHKRDASIRTNIMEIQARLEKDIELIRERMHKHGNDTAANTLAIAVVQANYTATSDRLTKIERCIEKVNDKQDEQTEILLKIYKEKT